MRLLSPSTPRGMSSRPLTATNAHPFESGCRDPHPVSCGGRRRVWGALVGALLVLVVGGCGSRAVEGSGSGRAVAVAAGRDVSCAVVAGGAVSCWGGDPVAVGGVTDATDVGLLSSAGCSARTHGEVVCWSVPRAFTDGRDDRALGAAEPIPGTSDVRALAVGADEICAVRAATGVACWAIDQAAAEGGRITVSGPRTIAGTEGATTVSIAAMSRGCAVVAGGRVRCWEDGAAHAVAGLVGVQDLSVTAGHACAVVADGQVLCWGDGKDGQLGNGATRNSAVPVKVHDIRDAVQVSVHETTSCAVRASGGIACWGDDSYGVLGNGNYDELGHAIPLPQTVRAIVDAQRVAVGFNKHACATTRRGTVECWGNNALGQLGDGTSNGSAKAVTVQGL